MHRCMSLSWTWLDTAEGQAESGMSTRLRTSIQWRWASKSPYLGGTAMPECPPSPTITRSNSERRRYDSSWVTRERSPADGSLDFGADATDTAGFGPAIVGCERQQSCCCVSRAGGYATLQGLRAAGKGELRKPLVDCGVRATRRSPKNLSV